MVKKNLITILFVMATIISIAQPLSHFEVDLSKATNGIDVPVSVSLDKLKISTTSSFSLVEIKGDKTLPVPFQVNKEENHPVQWSPIVGGLLLVGGILVIVLGKNKKA